MYGLEIAEAADVSRSVLYVVLGRMEDLGLIAGREEATVVDLHPRRRYRITNQGRTELAARLSDAGLRFLAIAPT